MKYAYPAILAPKGDGTYLVTVPDLPGCLTEGDGLAEALDMCADAMAMWLWSAESKGEPVPAPTEQSVQSPEFVSYVAADTDEYRKQHDARAVKKTLTIPAWLNAKAEAANAPFSQILQEGLKDYLSL